MITNDLQYYQAGSNSAVLGVIDPNAAAPVVNAQCTATSDRVVMLRNVFLQAATALPAGADTAGSLTAFRVQSYDMNYSTQAVAGAGNGVPLRMFGQNSGIHRYMDPLIGLWVSQQVDIRVTLDAAAILRGGICVDDLEGDQRWRQLVDSLRRSNTPPGRIDWLFGLGVQNIAAGATATFIATAARPAVGPGMLCIDTGSPHVAGDLTVQDISINNISQLPSLAQTIPVEAFEPQNFQRTGMVISKPLDLGTPVSVQITNNSGAPINSVHCGFVNPPAFMLSELARSYTSLPASERAELEKMGASPVQLLGGAPTAPGRMISR